MLAHPLEDRDLETLDPADYRVEWKWDGIRVQIVGEAGRLRLYSGTGDETGETFSDLVDVLDINATLDGELLVVRDGDVAPFNDLQKRLNRRTVSKKIQVSHPPHIRLYDILVDDDDDVRAAPFDERRERLAVWFAANEPPLMDLSEQVPFTSWDELATRRQGDVAPGVEGLMLKRGDSAHVPGRPKGLWYRWKRGTFLVDAVLIYAQRGHGKRSSFYSDYTFGVWRDGELVPVRKAYFGFTDEKLKELDSWVRNNTLERYGPVLEVSKDVVLEVAFEGLHRSSRHKSGIAACVSRGYRASVGTNRRPRPTSPPTWRRCRRNSDLKRRVPGRPLLASCRAPRPPGFPTQNG